MSWLIREEPILDWFALSVITALVWGFLPYFEKHAVASIDNGFTAVAIRSLGAAIGIFLPILSAPARACLTTVPLKAAAFLMLSGFVGSVIGQVTYLTAIRLGEVSRVTPVAAAWPVISFFVALVFLGEPVSLKKLVAVGLVMAGVFLLKA